MTQEIVKTQHDIEVPQGMTRLGKRANKTAPDHVTCPRGNISDSQVESEASVRVEDAESFKTVVAKILAGQITVE